MKTTENHVEEPIRHRRKRPSDVSKSSHKSKHKHEYVDCLVVTEGSFAGQCSKMLFSGTYCEICGKLGDLKYLHLHKNGAREEDVLQFKTALGNNCKVFKAGLMCRYVGEEVTEEYQEK